MKHPLAISGLGLVTPLERPGQTTFQAIASGCDVVDRGIVEESALSGMLGLCGPVPGRAGAFLSDPTLDKSLRLGYLVALQAIRRAGWDAAVLADPQTALFVGTSKGPVLTWMRTYEHFLAYDQMDEAAARQIVLGPGTLGATLACELNIGGPVHTSVAACSSGMHALHWAARAIDQGACRRALVVAADASAHPLFESSFARLGVLAKPGPDGHRRCRPLSRPYRADRGGFVLSEGAAAVALEPAEGCSGTLQVLDTWAGGDGTSLVALDPTTASLRHGLQTLANRAGSAIDFVHAHATGTSHDQHEWEGIQAVLPKARLDMEEGAEDAMGGAWVFSHKRYLGHSLGAAGLIGVVLSAACHRARRTLGGRPIQAESTSVTISQGFGGHIGMALLQGT